MAERIGSAYVRVFFRSSGEDRQRHQERRGVREVGQTAAEKVGEGFNSEWTEQHRERMKNDEENNRSTTAYKRKMTLLKNDLEKFWTRSAADIDSGNAPSTTWTAAWS